MISRKTWGLQHAYYYEVTPRSLLNFDNPTIIDDHTFQATVEGYAYKIFDENDSLTHVLPPNLANCESPRINYSLLIESNTIVDTEEKLELAESITLFPNPTNGKVSVNLPDSSYESAIFLNDLTGKRIELSNYRFYENKVLELNLEDLPPGIYFLSFSNGDTFFSKKIIKI